MKNVLFIFAMLFLQVGVTAQDSDVPANVQKALNAKYKSIESVDWTVGDNYTANFWQGDFYLEATFDKTGKWLETSTVLEETNLPQSVLTGIKKDVGEYSIAYVIKIDKNDNTSTYVVDVNVGEDTLQVTTDMTGNVLNKEVVEYEEEGDGGGF